VGESFLRIAIGSYLCWLLLVVLLVLGQYTPIPQFDIIHSGIVFGGVVLSIVGVRMLLRGGYRWITR
jgi:hypothetical protein